MDDEEPLAEAAIENGAEDAAGEAIDGEAEDLVEPIQEPPSKRQCLPVGRQPPGLSIMPKPKAKATVPVFTAAPATGQVPAFLATSRAGKDPSISEQLQKHPKNVILELGMKKVLGQPTFATKMLHQGQGQVEVTATITVLATETELVATGTGAKKVAEAWACENLLHELIFAGVDLPGLPGDHLCSELVPDEAPTVEPDDGVNTQVGIARSIGLQESGEAVRVVPGLQGGGAKPLVPRFVGRAPSTVGGASPVAPGTVGGAAAVPPGKVGAATPAAPGKVVGGVAVPPGKMSGSASPVAPGRVGGAAPVAPGIVGAAPVAAGIVGGASPVAPGKVGAAPVAPGIVGGAAAAAPGKIGVAAAAAPGKVGSAAPVAPGIVGGAAPVAPGIVGAAVSAASGGSVARKIGLQETSFEVFDEVDVWYNGSWVEGMVSEVPTSPDMVKVVIAEGELDVLTSEVKKKGGLGLVAKLPPTVVTGGELREAVPPGQQAQKHPKSILSELWQKKVTSQPLFAFMGANGQGTATATIELLSTGEEFIGEAEGERKAAETAAAANLVQQLAESGVETSPTKAFVNSAKSAEAVAPGATPLDIFDEVEVWYNYEWYEGVVSEKPTNLDKVKVTLNDGEFEVDRVFVRRKCAAPNASAKGQPNVVPDCLLGLEQGPSISEKLSKHPKTILSELWQKRVISQPMFNSMNNVTTVSATYLAINKQFVGEGTGDKKTSIALSAEALLQQLKEAGAPIETYIDTLPSAKDGATGADPFLVKLSAEERTAIDGLLAELKAEWYVDRLMGANPPTRSSGGWNSWRTPDFYCHGSSDGASPSMTDPRRRIESGRDTLPVAKHTEEIVKAVQHNQVVLICGAPGSGKTTQVPQYLLDRLTLESGGPVRIAISQPRRISAISTARRVAWERGEELGQSVGYEVRFDSSPPQCRDQILFITAGLLLRRLSSSSTVNFTHVILDEIHERSLEGDFLLAIFNMILRWNPSLKLVLMSATIEVEKFRRYFGGCPALTVEGNMFPVEEYFLEDVLRITGLPRAPPEEEGTTTQMVRLTCGLVRYIVQNFPAEHNADSVLVFLPGWDDIQQVRQGLQNAAGKLRRKLLIMPLHSMLGNQEQQTIFKRAPPGMLKIILSTNIAETSVTIPDVAVVIDAGRVKQKTYVPNRRLSLFGATWIAKSSAKQRAGRAGRVRNGVCYRLFSWETWQEMDQYSTPEIQRVAMHQAILQVMQLDLGQDPVAFLGDMLDPPPGDAIMEALNDLERMDCLVKAFGKGKDKGKDKGWGKGWGKDQMQTGWRLTVLGSRLARLPGVDPHLGRTLFLGILFSVLDPVLTAVASFQLTRPAFLVSKHGQRCRDEAITAKQRLTADTPGSDDLAVIAAFEGWREAQAVSQSQGDSFCEANCLDPATMRNLQDLRKLILGDLVSDLGLTSPDGRKLKRDDADACLKAFSHAAPDRAVVRAVVVAGLYPNFACHSKGRAYWTGEDGVCLVHSDSVNSRSNPLTSRLPFCAYQEKVRTGEAEQAYVFNYGNSGGSRQPTTSLRHTTLTAGMSLLLFSYDSFQLAPISDGSNGNLVRIFLPDLGTHAVFVADMEDALRIDAARRGLWALLRRFAAEPTLAATPVEILLLMTFPTLLQSGVALNGSLAAHATTEESG